MIGSLDRFLDAQNSHGRGYAEALAEINNGAKRSHWIWYVFPQLAGLGRSPAAQAYAISDRREAEAYLRHDMLRDRLLEITSAVLAQLRAGGLISTLMGSEIDALKLVSSLTLFHNVASDVGDAAVARAASDVLEIASAQGYPPCEFTRASLERSR